MTPLVRRTWGLRGKTPVFFQAARSLKKISVIGALCLKPRRKPSLYFRLHPNKNLNAPACIDFLRQLKANIRGNILVVWDRLSAHRTKKTRRFAKNSKRLSLHYFPPYAPELNPIEYTWGYSKMNSLCQFAPKNGDQLASRTKKTFHKLKHNSKILSSFFKQSPLPFF